jgi:hypothetical protein
MIRFQPNAVVTYYEIGIVRIIKCFMVQTLGGYFFPFEIKV